MANNCGLMNPAANAVIDALGGTTAVARLCEISPPSVHGWREGGIPNGRMLFFKALFSDKLVGIDLLSAVSRKKNNAAAQ